MIPLFAPLAALAAWYAIFIFPFAYFRHDDWLIIGNGATLPSDWGLLWRPVLSFPSGEQTWFFRPFFKLGAFLFYSAFGLNYWLWLAGTLAMTVAAAWLGAQVILRLTGSRDKALWFVTLFAAAVPLHFGSLTWVGEGMMNCPQVLGLIASTWLCLRGLLDRAPASQAAGVAVFLMTLGFKESTVFHLPFLFALLVSEKKLRAIPLRSRALAFAPYALVGGVYLVIRLLKIPLNPAYLPERELREFVRPLLVILVALCLPVAIFARIHSLSGLRSKWPYLPFLGVMILPYLGHHFFSPGWLFYPGFFFLLILCLSEGELRAERRRVLQVGFAVFALSLAPVLYYLQTIGWWQWHRGEREMVRIVATLDPKSVSAIEVYSCRDPRYPASGFERVVANDDSLYFMWKLHHQTEIRAVVGWCSTLDRGLASRDEHAAILRWEFPDLIWVRHPLRSASSQ